MSLYEYSPREELANRLTHALGALLSVAGLVLMVVYAAIHGTAWHVTSTAIFGATLVLLYTSSTLYHSFKSPAVRRLFQKFDHAAIFLLIAGTYTPFVLGPLRGPWGWTLFGIVWGLAAIGVTLKFWYAGRFDFISTMIYLGMGWLVIIAIRPLLASVPGAGVGWLVAGGLCYTFGALFYLWEKMPFNHAVWHLWVLGGSACHWLAVFIYVIPRSA